MFKTKFITSSVLIFTMGVAIQGCGVRSDVASPTTQAETNVNCTPADISVQCLLEETETVLGTVETPGEWIGGATELAIALASAEKTEEAWALFQRSVAGLSVIDDDKARQTALSDIALAFKTVGETGLALPLIQELNDYASQIDDIDVKADIEGKIITATAVHDGMKKAENLASAMPTESSKQDAYRGRTQREIAAKFADKGDFDSAIALADKITAKFTYYQGIAFTDIMSAAAVKGRKDLINVLLPKAEAIAVAQNNQYFAAGILRDIGHSLIVSGDRERGLDYIEKARLAAKNAPKPQEQARSTSRIATRLTDAGITDGTRIILTDAEELLEAETSKIMIPYSRYEIAGSAAFTENFNISERLLATIPNTPFSSATSLKSTAQRDLAWGYVRAGQVEKGIGIARSISTSREKTYALSRIIRLLNSPDMEALPRYL